MKATSLIALERLTISQLIAEYNSTHYKTWEGPTDRKRPLVDALLYEKARDTFRTNHAPHTFQRLSIAKLIEIYNSCTTDGWRGATNRKQPIIDALYRIWTKNY